MVKTYTEAVQESTCRKRLVICEIYNEAGELLARESNRCDPEGGKCRRIGVVQGKQDYPYESECNWTHAEIMAIRALPPDATPKSAVIYGHEFACNSCQSALSAAGVEYVETNFSHARIH